MIVRDVVLSSELRALPDGQRRLGRETARLVPMPDTLSRPDLPREASPQPPARSTVEVETAGSWLAAQSVAMRTALARELTEDLEIIRERGHTEGLELGRQAGVREIAQRTESSLQALSRVVAVAEEAFSQDAARLAEACADIVSEAFLKIAGERLASREATVGAVLEVLKRVKDEREVTIRVSAEDLPLLREHESRIQEALAPRRWAFVADPRVSAGGCLVESRLGTLDGRLEIQLHELCETIRAAKAARRGGA